MALYPISGAIKGIIEFQQFWVARPPQFSGTICSLSLGLVQVCVCDFSGLMSHRSAISRILKSSIQLSLYPHNFTQWLLWASLKGICPHHTLPVTLVQTPITQELLHEARTMWIMLPSSSVCSRYSLRFT